MEPKEILEHARRLIREHAGDDEDKWWYANRFVFARLQLDERKTKVAIKKELFDAGASCYSCGRPFVKRQGVHLHRLDSKKGYHRGNCVLMHAECHQKWHSEVREDDPAVTSQESFMTQVRRSKRYDGMPFLYWWDITPSQAEQLADCDAAEFVKKDTGERCVVSAESLARFLLPERQSTRGFGSWGVKVLKDHGDALAFEPGADGDEWLFLPVVWIDEETED